ncbi:MAG: polymorphic toxin-type HINT domain-containing protein [Candidatus Nanoarchaeia archaeon]|nr:polymorphic toxin-type HINT domain-containing protein [Candidatus Nanoarchaeia archaeon]
MKKIGLNLSFGIIGILFLFGMGFIILTVFSAPFVISQELKVTSEHPFLINHNWITAKELMVGDELSTISGSKAIITKITRIVSEGPVEVYNLEAGFYHNFVVEKDNLVVHNSDAVTRELSDLLDEVSTDDSYLKKFVEIDAESDNAKKYLELAEKAFEDLTDSDKNFARSFTEDVLNSKGLVKDKDYVYDETLDAFKILPKEGDNVDALNNIANRCGRRNVDVYIYPTQKSASETNTWASYNSAKDMIHYATDALFNQDIFKTITKHEFEHLITFHTAFKKLNPTARDLASAGTFKVNDPVRGYDQYIADEMYARWGEAVHYAGDLPKKSVGDVKCLQQNLQGLRNSFNKIKDFAESIEKLSQDSIDILDKKLFNPSVVKTLQLDEEGKIIGIYFDNKEFPILGYRLHEFVNRQNLEVIFQFENGEATAFYLPNDNYVNSFNDAFNTGVLDQNMLFESLISAKFGVKSQLESLLASAKHSRVAAEAGLEEINQILTQPKDGDIMKRFCDFRYFIARTQLSRGAYSPETGRYPRLDLTPYYSSEDVPSARNILNNLNQHGNQGCCQ